MALEIASTEAIQVVTKTEAVSSTTRIRGVYFNFDNTSAIADIAHGKGEGEDFVMHKSEIWALSGAYYAEVITVEPTGATAAEVLLSAIAGVVANIQFDNDLKQSILESGELKIGQDSIFSFMGT
tara:strand:- start:148 stop:522 length:375 start_codon:yes stop_codon:yes gene_type:complete